MPHVPAETGPKVLIAIADSDLAGLLAALLSPICDVAPAASGTEALQLAAVPPLPDLVLLDRDLPDMSGLEACRTLKAAPSTAAIPVVFITGRREIDDAVQVFDAGGVDYVCKPLNPPLVTARIRMHLALAEQSRALRQRSEQLETLNRELEAFSYSVSHDLRAPLRAIRGFSQLLQEECGEQLGEQGRDYLQRVMTAGERMDELIDEFLGLSRVSRSQLECEEVDLSGLVRRSVDDICQRHARKGVAVLVQDSVEVRGDARLLRIAVDNLLENACKFTAQTEHPQIEFGMRTEQGAPVYFLRDNGAGFDPRYAAKLFAPFQRLHSNHDYPGTGIGLATVQRIISRHGGRIWASAVIGRGAEFCFTLAPA